MASGQVRTFLPSTAFYPGGHWCVPVSRDVIGAGDFLRQPRQVSRRRTGCRLYGWIFQPEAFRRRAVLPDHFHGQSGSRPGRRQYPSTRCAGEGAGHAILVGNGLRSRDPRTRSQHAMGQPVIAELGTPKECRRLGRDLLRTESARWERIQLGFHQREWKVRGSVPALRSREAPVRKTWKLSDIERIEGL